MITHSWEASWYPRKTELWKAAGKYAWCSFYHVKIHGRFKVRCEVFQSQFCLRWWLATHLWLYALPRILSIGYNCKFQREWTVKKKRKKKNHPPPSKVEPYLKISKIFFLSYCRPSIPLSWLKPQGKVIAGIVYWCNPWYLDTSFLLEFDVCEETTTNILIQHMVQIYAYMIPFL